MGREGEVGRGVGDGVGVGCFWFLGILEREGERGKRCWEGKEVGWGGERVYIYGRVGLVYRGWEGGEGRWRWGGGWGWMEV